MALRLYLVGQDLVDLHPTIADLVGESTAIMGNGWRHPVGLLDHVRRHHGIMSSKDIAPFLIGYFVHHIMRQSRAVLVVLPEKHQGHTYLGTLVGAGVWRWEQSPTLAELRTEMLECFLARDTIEAQSLIKSAHNLLMKSFPEREVGSAIHQLVISQGQWEDANITLHG